MITATLVLTAVFTQAPDVRGWHGAASDAREITGRVELTAGEARDAAREQALEELRDRVERRGRDLAERIAPDWMPAFQLDLTLDRWLRALTLRDALHVIDEQIQTHDHGGYTSYRATLVVDSDRGSIERDLRDLRHRVEEAGETFLAKSGGTVLWWGLLALLCAWLDRLTRGYMTWRLRAIFAGMGLAVPGIAFVLI